MYNEAKRSQNKVYAFSDIDFLSIEISREIRKKITLTFLDKSCKHQTLKVNGGFISTKESIIWFGST